MQPKKGDLVKIDGPPGSAQGGRSGVVVSTEDSLVQVKLDGEERPRNFFPVNVVKLKGKA